MKFKTRIDWWFWLTFIAFSAATIWFTCLVLVESSNGEYLFGTIILWVAELGFFLPMILWTYYRLDKDVLYVRHWFFSVHIPYGKIVEITEPTTFSARSMTLSTKRIQIKYNVKNSWLSEVAISPKQKQEFLLQLKENVNKTTTQK